MRKRSLHQNGKRADIKQKKVKARNIPQHTPYVGVPSCIEKGRKCGPMHVKLCCSIFAPGPRDAARSGSGRGARWGLPLCRLRARGKIPRLRSVRRWGEEATRRGGFSDGGKERREEGRQEKRDWWTLRLGMTVAADATGDLELRGGRRWGGMTSEWEEEEGGEIERGEWERFRRSLSRGQRGNRESEGSWWDCRRAAVSAPPDVQREGAERWPRQKKVLKVFYMHFIADWCTWYLQLCNSQYIRIICKI